MAVKTAFTHADFGAILSLYDVGAYTHSAAISQGTVQTNYFLRTTRGEFVFRYYECRPTESVLFESELLAYLAAHHYPCPAPVKNTQGTVVGMYRHKPYVLFEFLEGQAVEHPTPRQKQQLIQRVSELQTLTQGYDSPYTPYRWNYSPDLCRTLAREEAMRSDTARVHAKFAWLARELTTLDLPPALPKAICHCDMHFSNILFQGDELVALLDFDDANVTFAQFDLVGLIEYWAWPYPADMLDLATARGIAQAYGRHRPLAPIEQQHLYDVYKLSILFDCVWYFNRGSADDFYEKRKIDALNDLGRQTFFAELFGR